MLIRGRFVFLPSSTCPCFDHCSLYGVARADVKPIATVVIFDAVVAPAAAVGACAVAAARVAASLASA